MCTAGRRPPTYQLAVPFSRAGLLRFTSGLQYYSDSDGVAVVFRVRRHGSAARGREVYRKWWMLTFVQSIGVGLLKVSAQISHAP